MRAGFILVGEKSVNTCAFAIVSLLMLRFGWGDRKGEKERNYEIWNHFYEIKGVSW